MRRDKGFTLVELLVVIAVIALLMAILMPTLQRVKRQAKAVICRSNLRQWGLWFPMYTADNDDRFFGNYYDAAGTDTRWIKVMQPYYKDCNDLLLCPMAAKHNPEEHSRGSTFTAWVQVEGIESWWAGGLGPGPRMVISSQFGHVVVVQLRVLLPEQHVRQRWIQTEGQLVVG